MSVPTSKPLILFALLSLVMLATRFLHDGDVGLLPDASWAVFCIGGFYLARHRRWALALLLIEAVGVDGIAFRYFGLSNFCTTLAYWFIVPAYSMLWLGGAWLRRHYQQRPIDLVRLSASLVVSVTACYLITHSAFYWLAGRVEHPSMTEWWSELRRWYGLFLGVTSVYVALAVLVHVVLLQRPHASASLQTH